MGIIYAQAKTVFIWLGLSNQQEQHLQRFLRWPRSADGAAIEIRHPDADPTVVDSVIALWQNEYWSRLWIVQEVALAKSVSVMTRLFSICLEDLCLSMLKTKPAFGDMQYPSITDLLALRDLDTRPLWFLLKDYVSSAYQCAQPNDHLYGLLGLMDSSREFARVDYNRPYGHVILDAILEAEPHGMQTSFSAILDNFARRDKPLGLIINANELENYLQDMRTLPKHRSLAELALKAFDAVCWVLTAQVDPQLRVRTYEGWQQAISSPALWRQNSAALLGISLALWSSQDQTSRLLNDWKMTRFARKLTKSWYLPYGSWHGSAWRCSVHLNTEPSPYSHLVKVWKTTSPSRKLVQLWSILRRPSQPSSLILQNWMNKVRWFTQWFHRGLSREMHMQEYLLEHMRLCGRLPSREVYMAECQKDYGEWDENSPDDEFMEIWRCIQLYEEWNRNIQRKSGKRLQPHGFNIQAAKHDRKERQYSADGDRNKTIIDARKHYNKKRQRSEGHEARCRKDEKRHINARLEIQAASALACKYAGRDCDGSAMVFEAPVAYLRTILDGETMRLEFVRKES